MNKLKKLARTAMIFSLLTFLFSILFALNSQSNVLVIIFITLMIICAGTGLSLGIITLIKSKKQKFDMQILGNSLIAVIVGGFYIIVIVSTILVLL